MNAQTTASEKRMLVVVAVAVVLISSLPYLWGLWVMPSGAQFMGLTHNIDDGAVYLSWMRQAADGHFFIRNLFTAEPQHARSFNLLFLAMGGVAALTRLPLIVVFHLFRIVLAVALLFAVWKFSHLFLDKPEQRRVLLPLLAFSAGLGWMVRDAAAPNGPVDMWQPEAITFLSIYLNPLFLAGLLLMVGILHFLEIAQRTRHLRPALYAGLCALVLGNVHTYDVVTVAAVWGIYLVVLFVMDRKVDVRLLGLSALAAAIASPAAVYQAWLLYADPVFRARAGTPAPSPPVASFLIGFGLVLAGAAIGALISVRESRTAGHTRQRQHNRLLVIVWSVVGFVVPYVPVAQQRKLVMGLHIPLCILCCVAMCAVCEFFRNRKTFESGFSTNMWTFAPAVEIRVMFLAVLFWTAVVMSPARFLLKDVELLNQGRTVTHYRPYLLNTELAAIEYLRKHAKLDDVVLAPPDVALFIPALAGMRVYYGHWSETPDYVGKLAEYVQFAREIESGTYNPAVPSIAKASYLVGYGDGFADAIPADDPNVDEVYANDDVVIWRSGYTSD